MYHRLNKLTAICEEASIASDNMGFFKKKKKKYLYDVMNTDDYIL